MRQINTRFFLILVGSLALLTAAVFGIHRLQAGNIAGALRFQADQAEKNGKPDQAARYLGRYLEFAPDDLDQRARLALLLADPKRATTAKARSRAKFAIDQVLVRDPQRHELRLAQVRLALDGRQFDLTKEHLTALEKALPDSGDVALLSGQYHEAQEQRQQAVECYRRAVKANPEKAEGYLKLAGLLRQLDFGKEPQHAAEIARLVADALEKAPRDAAVLSLAAQHAQEKGDAEAARKYLETGLQNDPTEPSLYQALSRVHVAAGKRTEAHEALRRGLKAVGKEHHLELNWALANLLMDDNRLDEAREVIAKLRETNAYSADYLEARGRMQQGRWFEAAKMLEKLRPAFKASKELIFQVDLYLGSCYQKLDEPALQLTAYRRAVEADPTSRTARYGLATAHWSLGNTAEALAQFRQIVQGNANRAEAARWRVEYARMLLQSSPKRTAQVLQNIERELDEAEKDVPQSVEAALLRAELCYLRNQPEEADAILRRAAQANEGRHEPWLSLASVALTKGDTAGAEKLLQEAGTRLGDTAAFRLAQVNFWLSHRGEQTGPALSQLEGGLERFAANDRAKLTETLAAAHFHLGKLAESERLLKQLTKLQAHAEDVPARMQLFNLALLQDNDAEMRRVLDEIKAIEGDAPAVWCHGEALRLIWHARRGKKDVLDEARSLLTQAAARRPDWHAVFTARGEIDQLQGKAEQAVAHYRKAIDLGSRDPQVMRQLVALLTQAQRFEEAEQEIRKMQQQFGLTADLQQLAVAVSFNRKDFSRMAQLARQSVRPDSTNYREHLWMGQVLSARGQASSEAEQAFRRAVALGEKQPEAWVGLVRYLVGTGQTAKANQEVQKAAELLDAAQRPLALAQCHELLGNVPQALENYREALKQQPRAVLVHRAAADYLVRVGRLRDAEALYRKVIERRFDVADEDVTAARRGLAYAIAKGGDAKRLPEALGLVDLTLQENGEVVGKPVPPEEQLAQARVLATFGHHGLRAKAIATLEELHQKQELQAEDQFLLARLLHLHGSDQATWKKTREVLKGLAAAYPNHPRYLGYHANLLLLRKEVADAEPLIARLERVEKDRKLSAGTFGSVELQARALEQRGKEAQAVALLKAYAEQDGAPPARQFLLAGLHGRMGNYQEAVDLCEQVRKAGRRDEAFSVAAGILRSGRPEPSRQDRRDRWRKQVERVESGLVAALENDPENVPLRLQLADVAELLGKHDVVEAACRQALAEDATNLVALNNLAWLLANRPGKADEALELINRALEKYGPRPELLDTRAVVYLSLKRTEQSVRDLEKVVREAPTPTRLFHLSRAHHQSRNAPSALAALQRANDLGLSVQQLQPAEQDAYQRLTAELQPR